MFFGKDAAVAGQPEPITGLSGFLCCDGHLGLEISAAWASSTFAPMLVPERQNWEARSYSLRSRMILAAAVTSRAKR